MNASQLRIKSTESLDKVGAHRRFLDVTIIHWIAFVLGCLISTLILAKMNCSTSVC